MVEQCSLEGINCQRCREDEWARNCSAIGRDWRSSYDLLDKRFDVDPAKNQGRRFFTLCHFQYFVQKCRITVPLQHVLEGIDVFLDILRLLTGSYDPLLCL